MNKNRKPLVAALERLVFCLCRVVIVFETEGKNVVLNIFSHFQMTYRRDVGYFHQVSASQSSLSLICVSIYEAQLWDLEGIVGRCHL